MKSIDELKKDIRDKVESLNSYDKFHAMQLQLLINFLDEILLLSPDETWITEKNKKMGVSI